MKDAVASKYDHSNTLHVGDKVEVEVAEGCTAHGHVVDKIPNNPPVVKIEVDGVDIKLER